MTGREPALWLRSPQHLLEHLGIAQASDLVLESIAQACGATIVYQPLHGCEARLVGVGQRAIITVNEQSGRSRQRFSAAHELGHWLHDRGKVAFACAESDFLREWGDANVERRANRFAADLLLPRTMFKRRIRRQALTFELAQHLADEFTTSLTATTIRLVELGPLPGIVACFYRGTHRWEVRSQAVPKVLKVRSTPPSWAAAVGHEDEARGTARGPARAFPAEAWIDHPDAGLYTVYAESCRIGVETVLVLLTWKDEEQIADAAARR